MKLRANRIRLLLVDDTSAIVEALVDAIEPFENIQVVGTANSGDEAITLARRLQPDVVLMDIRMPGMDGVKAVRAMTKQGLPSRVLMMTAYEDDSLVQEAGDAGAAGYLVKGTLVADIVSAIEATMDKTLP